jgi:hypothetical protein
MLSTESVAVQLTMAVCRWSRSWAIGVDLRPNAGMPPARLGGLIHQLLDCVIIQLPRSKVASF